MDRAAFSNVTTTGYGGHSYRINSEPTVANMEAVVWKCTDAFSVEYIWHTYIAVPYNTQSPIDGSYWYHVDNTNNAEDFDISVNQENFGNQWVYLGWSKGKGGNNDTSKCYVGTNNRAPSGYEFWVDHMKYWPKTNTTPPNYTHGW